MSISWQSSEPSVISTTGSVTHPDGTGVTTVTLTAGLTKGKASDTKKFIVKVYQKNRQPSLKEILQSVQINFSYKENIFNDQEVSVDTMKNISGKEIKIKYASDNQKYLNVSGSGNKITVHRDIADINVTLTVTLT